MTTTESTTAAGQQLSEIGNQMYLSFLDGVLQTAERNIKLAQYFLSEVDAVQRELRRAFEHTAEQFRAIEGTARTFNGNVLEATAQIFEANRNIALQFNNVFADAQQRNASFLETAISEGREASRVSRTKTAEAVNRSKTAGEIVLGQAEKVANGAARRQANA